MKNLTGIIFLFVSIVTAQHTVTEVGTLLPEINESSGLLYLNGKLLTHNDSGNTAVLYEIDTTDARILREVSIINVSNNDWEALAQDSDYIYIGDFGNNVGTRTDLAIYRIEKNQFLQSNDVVAEIIEFQYEDQTDFSDNGNSDWDAEAMITLGDQLIIFTKQWQSLGTVAYSIPKTPGIHTALKIGAIGDVGLVTDATYHEASQSLHLLGYSNILTPFLFKFEAATETDILPLDYVQYDLELSFVQTEGLALVNENELYFTSEYFSRQTPAITSEARLFKLKIINDEEPEVPPLEPEQPQGDKSGNKIRIYRDASLGEYTYEIQTEHTLEGSAIFDTSGRMIWESGTNPELKGAIAGHLGRVGIFYFTAYLDAGILSIPFAVY